MSRAKRYSPEYRERAVRMLQEQQDQHSSQWAAMTSIAAKVGCTVETLRKWVKQAEIDHGKRDGLGAGSYSFVQLQKTQMHFRLRRNAAVTKLAGQQRLAFYHWSGHTINQENSESNYQRMI